MQTNEIQILSTFETKEFTLGPLTITMEGLTIAARLHRDYQELTVDATASFCEGVITADMHMQVSLFGDDEECENIAGEIEFPNLSLASFAECMGLDVSFLDAVEPLADILTQVS